MQTRSFQKYLEKRLDQTEIKTIEKQAHLEKKLLESLQSDVANAVSNYMHQEKIGFNELTRRLAMSPTQLARIQRGQANLTLATIAHIFALLNCQVRLVFK